ncbi:unnamed protein product [Strongylus vulgaris]|uniref:Uncharacterized protein n=1 Tax=Strongylus vulgaris TaxID=40348 RepID=A0A3P7JW69_STRVU|nr:unnamed protein product [Strongylus vulgaris]
MCEEEWAQYEIIPGPLTAYHNYRFWWMFITRNALDRILPFFVLVAMNYLIIRVCVVDIEHVCEGSYYLTHSFGKHLTTF